MKRVKRTFAFLLAMILCIGMMAMNVSAASSEQDGMEASLTTDKSEYSQNEPITVTLTVTNTNEVSVSNIAMESLIPEGYSLADNAEAIKHVENLDAGEIVSMTVTYVTDSTDGDNNTDDEQNPSGGNNNGSSNTGNSNTNGNGTTQSSESNIQTGDNTNAVFWITVAVISGFGIIVTLVFKKKKSGKGLLSLFLCLTIVVTFVPFSPIYVDAAGTQKSIILQENVRIADSDFLLEASISYDEIKEAGEVTEDTDTDQDNITDAYEILIGTDPNKSDTDEDGLSDELEILIGTDPTLADTDDNGIMDGDEDTDGDGITNFEELDLGTDPAKDDSDHDGLNDLEEINQYATDPLNKDTDGDGAYDGWEVEHGYDPLAANALFDVTETAEGSSITAQVDLQISGDQITTVNVDEVAGDLFLDENVPGYIGSAFDFSVDGNFNAATISFTFDESFLSQDDFVPVIYYYNEDTQCLEELETTINGNIASAVVNHFSRYILLNKTALDQVWDNDIKSPSDANLDSVNGIDVVFVIDSSGSMGNNDSSGIRKAAAQQFVDKLGEHDRGAVVDFDSYASVYQEFTSDHDLLYTAINRINSSGGTNLSRGISTALSLFTSESYSRLDAYKCIVFLTDGDGTYSTSYTTQAADNGVVIYTIGLGSGVRESTLSAIAEGTGGKYYFASSADELPDIYGDVSFETIDYTTDSNADGISDYYTQLLCDGSLKLGTGKSNPFNGYSYDEIQAGNDYDGDGLLNGQELVVKYDENYNKVYVWMLSDPTSLDSDFDGIDDSEEEEGCSTSNYFTADMRYKTGDNSYDTSVSFNMDYRWFFADNTEFNQDLSVLASLYSIDMYDDGWLELSSGTTGNSNAENGVSLGSLYGLNDCVNYNSDSLGSTHAKKDSSGNTVDSDDVSEVFIGHRLVSYNGEQREIIFLTVRGTNGTNAEWSSNFDIGADTSEYYDRTGEHPDWSNKDNHKGFDVAATRIMDAYDQYISEVTNQGTFNPSVKRSIFITGHSRGGAIANILGALFEDEPSYDSYVYTMAAPYTTTSSSYDEYKTIFNIMNTDDLVPYLPLYDWGFHKYGRTLTISVKDNYEDTNPVGNAVGTFEAAFNKDYDSNLWKDAAVNSFKKIANKRADFYILDTTSGDGEVLEGLLHVTDSAYNDMDTMLTVGKMKKYCKLNKNQQLVGYTISVIYSPAYVAQNIANLAGDISGYDKFDWIGIDLKGKYSTARRDFALASGFIPVVGSATGGMECPHMPATYYLISRNTSYTKYN